MKKLLACCIRFVLFFPVINLFYSCQKELNEQVQTNEPTTVTDSLSLIRQIKLKKVSVSDPVDYTVSFQYDTVNRKIKLYLDDTLTTNPFDLLAISYEFNTDGYLAKSEAVDDNGMFTTDYSIIRNTSNQIRYIVEYNVEDFATGGLRNDTIYYSYHTQGGQILVQDSVRIQSAGGFGTTRTVFNTQNKPVEITRSSSGIHAYKKSFEYTTQGLTRRVTTETDTTDFVYDTHQLHKDWQKLSELFLGKDHYILSLEPYGRDRLSWYFLTYIIEFKFETIHQPFFINPLSSISIRGKDFTNTFATEKVNFTNSFSTDNKPTSIVIQPTAGDPIYLSIKYQY